ncbi:hypothetical protein K505DRAFT_360642 [Melanomma pulvis-pyrius CBS 109.77]|uniref:Aminoglycoside phosphotransferase domain-containing protein n=1 Tax=Melanomma pulvis-pyrius CBS 109.77 TaxID=1314802 RepID=A0A6A6XF30_9PLEO|nr:hypothetical protein K505DRAFT_360642 [Melanomma pulvis-pyrius CBS 109.77]
MEAICKAKIIEEFLGREARWNFPGLTDSHYYQNLPSAPVDITLPYRAEGNFDPPLPTPKDIANARTTAHDSEIPRPNVYKVFDTYIVKFSSGGSILQEAENLLFLEKNSRVRTPKVYAVFSHQGEDPSGLYQDQARETRPTYHYLVMEFIPGPKLSRELFCNSSPDVKQRICESLAEQLKRLREVQLGIDFYGRVNRTGWDYHLNMFTCPGKDLCGPYESYEDLVNAMVDSARFHAATGLYSEEFDSGTKLILANLKPSLQAATEEDRLPTLTHLNLQFHNIIVQQKGEDYDVIIMNWRHLGWLPAWVEAVTVLMCLSIQSWEEKGNLQWGVFQGFQPFNLALAQFIADCKGLLAYPLL